MSKLDDQIRAMVEQEFKKNPKTPTVELQKKAAKIKKSVAKLKLTQFRGRYVLAVSRKLSGKNPGPKKGSRRKRAVVPARKQKVGTELLRDSFEAKKVAINETLESAYQRVIASDSISRVERLLGSMDKTAQRMKKK